MSSKKSKPASNNPKKGSLPGKKRSQPSSSGRGPLAPVTTDSRFAHVHKDPRFTRPRKKDTKVTIDKRFAHMLKEDFSDTPKVDRYGRKLQGRSSEADLKKYYKIQDEGEDEDELDEEDQEEEDEDEDEDEDDEKPGRSVEQLEKELEEDQSNEEEDDDEMPVYDPARGEGVISSSEDDDDDDDDDDDAMEEDEDEEQGEIPTGDESHRLAVVNLDWDHVKAVDLFKIFNGFKPDGSVIRSVRVYPSEFGKERMAKEETEGPPKEIFKKGTKDGNESAEEGGDVNEKTIVKVDNGEEFDMKALRRYQLDRLKYYYALVDCDTVSTARAIYQACDGAEFERSANFFDMRYVPDGMDFEDEPRDEAHHAPENYKPVDFMTDALQHSKVKLTWDEDDSDRIQTTRRKFTKEDIKEMDFRAYLASSSDDDDSDENDPEETRRKYRSLLAGEGEDRFGKDVEEKEEGEMEITFAPGLSEKAAKAVDRRKGEEVEEDETTIEKYMRKVKDKRKAKKLAKKAGTKDDEVKEDEGEGGGALFSDDDFDVDTSDPFFAEAVKETSGMAPTKAQSKSTEKHAAKKKKSRSDREADARQRAELELLMSDGTGAPRGDGFDMREVLRREKAHGKKKGKKGFKSAEDEDDFEIDVADPRFAAVMESHHFAIDPTNPQYKKTKAMAKLQEERRKRQAEGGKEGGGKKARAEESTTIKKKSPFQDPSLSLLVESVKRKTVMATTPQEGKRKKAKI